MDTNNGQEADRIVIVGAGLAGLAMGIQLKRRLRHENFIIYEKDERVGGTWSQNTYPNLSCDVPSEYYSYSFFQNPDWTEKFASQPEILKYMIDTTRHFHLEPHLSFSQECLKAQWSDSENLWSIEFRDLDSDRAYTVKARYFITAMGVLNVPRGLDDLPLLREFRGQVFHTSQWRDIDFSGKRILVIGNGCSANQVIPWVLKNGSPKALTQIVRSKHWIAPKPNYRVGGLVKWILRYVPFAMSIRRLYTAAQLDIGFRAFYRDEKGRRLRHGTMDALRNYMTSVANPAYQKLLIPDYEFGAKRPIMDHGYLESTNRSDFALFEADGLQTVEGSDHRTLVDKAGNRHEVDVVIMANGFKTQDLLTPMTVRGLNGKDLRELWQSKGGSEAYMGVSVNGFPNFFMLAGPNTLPSSNSSLHGIECSVVYITRVLSGVLGRKKATSSQTSTLMPKENAEVQFNARLQEGIKKLVYSKEVSTWYINEKTGKNTLVWPGTQFSFWWSRCIKPVKWSDWLLSS